MSTFVRTIATKVVILIAQRQGLVDGNMGRTGGATLHVESPSTQLGTASDVCTPNLSDTINDDTDLNYGGTKKLYEIVGCGTKDDANKILGSKNPRCETKLGSAGGDRWKPRLRRRLRLCET